MQLNKTVVLITPALLLLLFSSSLIGVDRLAFRDVSHFYTPLYAYIGDRTATDWLPLWNPLDQTGLPLMGETTTAVLYPVRYVLYSLPLSPETAIAWYVVLHLMLASVTARIAARWLGVESWAANFAGLVYPLSGAILFLYTNPPFLVAASWLPLVLGVVLRVELKTIDRKVVIAAMALAMMILAGDPQTALHAMIVASGVWAVRLVRFRARVPVKALLFVPVVASLLSAPQLAASISWSSQSDRLVADTQESWHQPPLVGGKKHTAFQFSLPPWHVLEAITPHAFGQLLPQHRRVSQLIPGDGRMWTPTIYLGLLTTLCILAKLIHCRRGEFDCWSGILIASFGFSLGHFGLVWLIQATTGTMLDIDSAVGGPYWCLYQFVPGYESFRYPTKWLPFVSLAAAVLLAKRIAADWPSARLCFSLGGLGLLAFTVLAWLRVDPSLVSDPDQLPRDEFWGPLDVASGLGQMQWSILHTLIFAVVIGMVLQWRHRLQWTKQTLAFCLWCVLAIDLGWSGHRLVYQISRQQEAQLANVLSVETPPIGSRWLRTQTQSGWPNEWSKSPSEQRLLDVETSQRVALIGRWHLADRISVLNNMVSIQSRELEQFWLACNQLTLDNSGAERERYWSRIRQWLAIDGVTNTTEQSTLVPGDHSLVSVTRRRDIARPVANVHTRWIHDPTSSMIDRLEQITSDESFIPVVQSTGEADVVQNIKAMANVRVIRNDADTAEFQITSSGPTLLTRPVFQDGHWRATFSVAGSDTWWPATVFPVDHLTQGVILPAGEYRVRFEYSPWWLSFALLGALLGWIALIFVGAKKCLVWSVTKRGLLDSTEEPTTDSAAPESFPSQLEYQAHPTVQTGSANRAAIRPIRSQYPGSPEHFDCSQPQSSR